MGIKAYSQVFLLVCSFAFISQYIYNYINKKKRGKRRDIHEAILFSPIVITEKPLNSYMNDGLSKLCYYLNTTRYTLDLCIYVFTNTDLFYVILKLLHKGVRVRMIADTDMAFSTGSVVLKLEKAGMSLRWTKSTNLMHHKFCLIDASFGSTETTPLLVTGSLNWTNQALNGNWENVIVTSQEQLVTEYGKEFERLWEQFKPVV